MLCAFLHFSISDGVLLKASFKTRVPRTHFKAEAARTSEHVFSHVTAPLSMTQQGCCACNLQQCLTLSKEVWEIFRVTKSCEEVRLEREMQRM